MMLFKKREKFVQIGCNDLAGHAEVPAQLISNLRFRAAVFQKFEHAGPHEVQREHLSVKDIEDDSAVLVVRRADFTRKFHHGNLPAGPFSVNATSVAERTDGIHFFREMFVNLLYGRGMWRVLKRIDTRKSKRWRLDAFAFLLQSAFARENQTDSPETRRSGW